MNLYQNFNDALPYDAFLAKYGTIVDKDRWRNVYTRVTLTDAHTPLTPGATLTIKPRNPLYFDASGARIVQEGTS